MENTTFVQSLELPETNRQKMLEAMEKYQENHWWEPDTDPRKFAYYQLNEGIMLCTKFSQMHEGIELLLGRPVYTHEFGIDIAGLRQEAERAWTYQVGCTSGAERQGRSVESMDKLNTWAKANNKQVIEVNLPVEQD